MSSIGYIEACAAPLDRARRATFRWAAAFPWLRAVLYSRDRRIAVQASVGVALALALTIAAPVAMMAVSPIVLGVPHLASDVRYLVVRQRLPRWWMRALLGACLAMFALRVVDEIYDLSTGRLELATATVWMIAAACLGALVSRAWRRLAIALPPIALLGAAGLAYPATAQLVMAHLHNVVAIALWVYLFRRRLWVAAIPLAVVALAVPLLVSGATAPLTEHLGGNSAFGLALDDVSSWIAPGLSLNVAIGITLSYIFLQAIHYSVWLGWIPQEEIRGQSTMSWRASLRSLVRDLGITGVWIVIALTLVVVCASFADLHGTRNLYLSLAVFHGYLELAMLCYLVVARRPRAR